MPKTTLIRVERKFSKCVRRGGLEEWHGVTHAAEATLLEGETHAMAEEALDEEVRKGLVQAYATMRRGSQSAQEAVGDEEIDELPAQIPPFETPPPAPPVDPSWCDIHKVKMKKWTAKDGSGRSWYSHPVGERGAPDSFWCQGEQE